MASGIALKLEGIQFGKWTVLERAGSDGKAVFWKCRCECGTERDVAAPNLRSGQSKSCGCYQSPKKPQKPRHVFDDITGRKFSRWTVLGQSTEKNKWSCRCECGTERNVLRGNLTNSLSKSCGCLQVDTAKAANKYDAKNNPIYHAWAGMKDRCLNPKSASWKWYGARGINVCQRWQESFANFAEDMQVTWKPGLSLDRIDVDGHYEPQNCRWADRITQAKNRRKWGSNKSDYCFNSVLSMGT